MSDYLIHYGIPGQRWGVRRFQNKDGSLTAAGRKRQNANRKEQSSKKSRDSDKRTEYFTTARSGMTTKEYKKQLKEEKKIAKIEYKRVKDEAKIANAKYKKDKAAAKRAAEKQADLDDKSDSIKDSNERVKLFKAANDAVSSGRKVTSSAKEAIDKSIRRDEARARKKIDLSTMTDDDLRKAIMRDSLEKQYLSIQA